MTFDARDTTTPSGSGTGRPRARLGFPTEPDPDWTPAQRARWETARQVADAHPATPGQGGWTTQRLPVPAGPIAGLVLTGAGGLASVLAVLHGLSPYAGLAGILTAGLTGMVLAWHLPPADLATTPDHGAAGVDAAPAGPVDLIAATHRPPPRSRHGR